MVLFTYMEGRTMISLLGFITFCAGLFGLVVAAIYWTVKLSQVIPHVDQHTDSDEYLYDFRLFPWTKP